MQQTAVTQWAVFPQTHILSFREIKHKSLNFQRTKRWLTVELFLLLGSAITFLWLFCEWKLHLIIEAWNFMACFALLPLSADSYQTCRLVHFRLSPSYSHYFTSTLLSSLDLICSLIVGILWFHLPLHCYILSVGHTVYCVFFFLTTSP